MRVSLNQITEYLDFALPPTDELVGMINRQLGTVEDVTDLSEHFRGAVIVKVDSCEKHPNADKLHVCMVDDGSGDLTQVVCGAPNVKAGMFAVWLKPGATVPSTATDTEPFVLGARELRGVMSNGMLASPKELGLGDSHEGILEIDPDEAKPIGADVVPGVPFADAYGLNDVLIEIENKMFTHRPDLFGQLGVAREIAGIQGKKFISPDWYDIERLSLPGTATDASELTVFNDAGDGAPRFMAQIIRGVTIKPSPIWLQCALIRMGGKPINNVVDATNYIMLLTAQPTHAYDLAKIRGASIGARMAVKGETIRLLNGKTYELDDSDIVVADKEGPIGLAGIMGGGDSEVSNTTTDIVLEVANFDMYSVRKSSMRHGVFTDALTRFNKGQSPYQNPVVLSLLSSLITDISGGVASKQSYDVGDSYDRGYDKLQHDETGTITSEFINRRLGLSLTDEEVAALLSNVEFATDTDETGIDYQVPFWRTDIEQAEDIVEEVGRLYGFDKLPRELPMRSIAPAAENAHLMLKRIARTNLYQAGANEVLTYSFVHKKLLEQAGQDAEHAYKLSNALSPDLQYYRLSLTPSLLDKVHPNIKAGHGEFALFEWNKVHYKGEMDELEPEVPNEDEHIALVIAYDVKHQPKGSPYYSARRYASEVIDTDESELLPMSQFDFARDEWARQLAAPYEPERSVVIVKNDRVRGVIGEFTSSVRAKFKLPEYTAGFELHTDLVTTKAAMYKPLSRFPSVTQDVSIRVDATTHYDALLRVVRETIAEHRGNIDIALEPIGVYEPEGEAFKTTTLRLKMTSHETTLRDQDVKPIVEAIAHEVDAKLHGSVV